MIIGRHFTFEASHQLPNKIYGKCQYLHGHSYKLDVEVIGEINQLGMVCDFAEICKIVNSILDAKYDHKHLNAFIEIPTVENILQTLSNDLMIQFSDKDYRLYSITLYETENSFGKLIF